MELSERMRAVAGMVPRGYTAADIGCDHAFVSIYLVREGICRRGIAADLRPGPLAGAQAHIRESGLEGRIRTVLSDGLAQVPTGPEGAQVMIAAGMGGRLTLRILSAHPEKTAGLVWAVLEPQSEVWLVRRWLEENGFFIAAEDMVREEGKYYPVILAANRTNIREGALSEQERQRLARAERERAVLTDRMKTLGFSAEQIREAQARFGPCLIAERQPVLISYLKHIIGRNATLLAALPAEKAVDQSGQSLRTAKRRGQLSAEKALAEQVLRCMTEG